MERSKAESFTAYLKEKQRLERSKLAAPVGGGTAMSVLAAFAGLPSMPLTALQSASGMSFVEFAEALMRLQSSGYLTIGGEPGAETADLTPLGAEVAALARPA